MVDDVQTILENCILEAEINFMMDIYNIILTHRNLPCVTSYKISEEEIVHNLKPLTETEHDILRVSLIECKGRFENLKAHISNDGGDYRSFYLICTDNIADIMVHKLTEFINRLTS